MNDYLPAPVAQRDRMHVADEPPHPHKESHEPSEMNAAEDYAAVKVHVTNPVATTSAATEFGAYSTWVLAPGASGVEVLPHDPRRQYAYLYSADNPIVISTMLEQAQSAGNVAATVSSPQGAYIPNGVWTPPIRHNEGVYVTNTSPTLACRVTVLSERGNATG